MFASAVLGAEILMAFQHPGALETADKLEFVKAKIVAGAQPWYAWHGKACASAYARRRPTACVAKGGDACTVDGGWRVLNASHGNDAVAGDAGNDAFASQLPASTALAVLWPQGMRRACRANP